MRSFHVRCVNNNKKMHFSFFGLWLQVCLAASLGGCFFQAPPDDYLKFKELPIEKQHCEFKKLSIDKQIDYYLFDRDREPPDLRFADDIARQGTTVIPALLKRLREEHAEYRQEAIVKILEAMSRKYVDLRTNQEVIDAIKEAIAKMEDRDWQRITQNSLNAIERGPAGGLKPTEPLPPCGVDTGNVLQSGASAPLSGK